MKDEVSTVLCISTIKLFRKGLATLRQNFNRVQSNSHFALLIDANLD